MECLFRVNQVVFAIPAFAYAIHRPSITPQALKTFARTAQAHADRWRRLPPPSPPGARLTGRSRPERTAHHGIKKRAPAHSRRSFERKNGRFWRAQFCTEVARSERFELPTLGFEVLWSPLLFNNLAVRCCAGVAARFIPREMRGRPSPFWCGTPVLFRRCSRNWKVRSNLKKLGGGRSQTISGKSR
jgi:hypothetical protein